MTAYLAHDIYTESTNLCGSVQHQSESLRMAGAVFSQCTGGSCN